MSKSYLKLMTAEPIDAFEPVYPPQKIEFWLAHFEELYTLVHSPKSSAHIAEHLNREWILLQVRLRTCLCKEEHEREMYSVDPACTHEPSGGGAYRAGPETAECVMADLRIAASKLPPGWLATRRIWAEQLLGAKEIAQRVNEWRQTGYHEREPAFSRSIAIRRMAAFLGWGQQERAA